MKEKISIVVPFYNEEISINPFFDAIVPILKSTEMEYEIVCINDGSRDHTLEKLLERKVEIPQITIIDFSRNFGKEAAVTAGLDFATGNCVVPIDCDLQDPPELILEMLKKWRSGFDVVLGKRIDRSDDTFFKRLTSWGFYKVCRQLMNIELPPNVGDFRLMDRKVVDEMKKMRERTRFMKGLFAYAGFKTTYVEYKRPERYAGRTKWNYWKLWNYAIDGITSFSTVPLKIMTYFGFLVMTLAFLRGLWIIGRVIFEGIDVPGYASLMVAILFFGGLQLMGLGIVGEYIGRIYTETKQRPIYIVKEIL